MNLNPVTKIFLKLLYWLLAGVFFMSGVAAVLIYIGFINLPEKDKVLNDLTGIEVSQIRQILPSRDFRVSGVMKNVAEHDLIIAQIKIDVFLDDQLIDQCHAATQELVLPGSSLPFLAVCDQTDLTLFTKPLTFKTSVYQASFRK